VGEVAVIIRGLLSPAILGLALGERKAERAYG